ncbi:MAG: HDOD domain-containing protein, partial [Psychrosphaera sp.]|nr:HDOD domain-containing protein [Psychrosphaera sp.]
FDGFHIPSKPEILTKMERVLQADEPDMSALADLVAIDIGVSSVVLKTINAPFYGMSRTISEIKQAVMLLGMEVIRALVVGVILRGAYTQKSCISLERFWDSTTDIANTMVFIGGRIKDKVPLEKLYTTGLFQNCAIPAFAIKYKNYVNLLAALEDRPQLSPTAAENKYYGTNHAVMGYYIANSWGLPKEICRVILNHHDEQFLEYEKNEEAKLLYATLKISENVVNRVRRFKDTSDWERIGADVMDCLHMDKDEFDDIEDDVAEMFTGR